MEGVENTTTSNIQWHSMFQDCHWYKMTGVSRGPWPFRHLWIWQLWRHQPCHWPGSGALAAGCWCYRSKTIPIYLYILHSQQEQTLAQVPTFALSLALIALGPSGVPFSLAWSGQSSNPLERLDPQTPTKIHKALNGIKPKNEKRIEISWRADPLDSSSTFSNNITSGNALTPSR